MTSARRRATTFAVTSLLYGACSEPTPPSCELPTGLPVFPGAEGFGTTTPAGRGGRVLEVTTLDDAGAGSLRAAIDSPGPRVVVFRVGGIIVLDSLLEVHKPFLTVAGQTAPGDGITLRGAGIVVFTHDVLIQHLRIRPGSEAPINPDNNDALQINGEGASRVVADHLSLSWSEDEVISDWAGGRDVTISSSIVSEGLDDARHSEGAHSKGVLFGQGSSCISLHGNLLAHNNDRNPRISTGGLHDVVNNVAYDWGDIAGEVAAGTRATYVNFIGNVFIPGPSSGSVRELSVVVGHPVHHFADPNELLAPSGRPRLFVRDNLGPSRATSAEDEWRIVSQSYGDTDAPASFREATPFEVALVTAHPASEILDRVLAGAGATLPRRDVIDARIVDEVRSRSGSIIDRPADVGGYPPLSGGGSPPDADHDGMPDQWERARGLDPDDPLDAVGDDDADGYTNVEEWIFELAPH